MADAALDTVDKIELLSDQQIAEFVSTGVLELPGCVPAAINELFLQQAGELSSPSHARSSLRTLFELMARNRIPEVAAGTPLAQAYEETSAIARVLAVPLVRGAITSLVGSKPRLDAHFLHVTFPADYFRIPERDHVSQPTHQDSTIDDRLPFDIQLMYFPHAVSAEMGGTRYIPGTHLRVASEMALARYQNLRGQRQVQCVAGTVVIFHQGLWHGAGINRSSIPRLMFKIRLNPVAPQVNCWDVRAPMAQRRHIDAFVRNDGSAVWSLWCDESRRRRLWRYMNGLSQNV